MQQKNQYILYALYIIFYSMPAFISIALFYSIPLPSVSPPRYFLLFYTISTKNTIAKYMYNKMNKFKEGCNYMNLKKAKLFICTLLFTMAFVSVSSVSASKTPPTDTSTEENAPETESSEEIFHLLAILFFHYSKKQGFICRKDSKTVKTVVIMLLQAKRQHCYPI